MAPRETENNAYAKFSSDQQRVLWYVMIFSVVVNLQYTDTHTHLSRITKQSARLQKNLNASWLRCIRLESHSGNANLVFELTFSSKHIQSFHPGFNNVVYVPGLLF